MTISDRVHAPTSAWRTAALTTASMFAFAANSLLCRIALQPPSAIDPTSFGGLRLVSGALVLALIVRCKAVPSRTAPVDWTAAVMLWAYVACFSFVYRWLTAGTGALILFGAVQLTMFVAGLRAGERFGVVAWSGFVLAIAGLVYLVSPGVAAPTPGGAALMTAAGVAWGVEPEARKERRVDRVGEAEAVEQPHRASSEVRHGPER